MEEVPSGRLSQRPAGQAVHRVKHTKSKQFQTEKFSRYKGSEVGTRLVCLRNGNIKTLHFQLHLNEGFSDYSH